VYQYTLVLFAFGPIDAAHTVRNHLREWDDENGTVYRINAMLRSSEDRMIVQVVTNRWKDLNERDLNGWMALRQLGPIQGDLIWWSGMSVLG
jgi:hypothetical protein